MEQGPLTNLLLSQPVVSVFSSVKNRSPYHQRAQSTTTAQPRINFCLMNRHHVIKIRPSYRHCKRLRRVLWISVTASQMHHHHKTLQTAISFRNLLNSHVFTQPKISFQSSRRHREATTNKDRNCIGTSFLPNATKQNAQQKRNRNSEADGKNESTNGVNGKDLACSPKPTGATIPLSLPMFLCRQNK